MSNIKIYLEKIIKLENELFKVSDENKQIKIKNEIIELEKKMKS